jgi:hypothetical protein
MQERARRWIAACLVGGWPVAVTIYAAVLSRQSAGYAFVLAGLPASIVALTWLLHGRKELEAIAQGFLWCLGSYCLVYLGGLLVFLSGCSLVGYLPYSDRPGPGWGTPHLPAWGELGFYIGWELLLVPVLLFWAPIFFIFGDVMAWLRVPRWLLRLSSGSLCGFLSLIVTAGVGWYISIGAPPVYAGGGLGLLFGVFVLPRFATQRRTRWPVWARTIGATAAFLVVGTSIVYPILYALRH